MPFFVKKPIAIECRRWTGSDAVAEDIEAWSKGDAVRDRGGDETNLVVRTRHGRTLLKAGDWVARGPDGEFYPLENAALRSTYTEVEKAG